MKSQASYNNEIYQRLAREIAEEITKKYSSSFYWALNLIDNDKKIYIYSIYAYVRLVDELVDTFRPHSMKKELYIIKQQTKIAIVEGFSSNIIIYQFAKAIRDNKIPLKYIDAFLSSMIMDVKKKNYNYNDYKKYIYGSAEVIGLMCLYIFFDGNPKLVAKIARSARFLGAGFQKVNFLRDLSVDKNELGRFYFPGHNYERFNEAQKLETISEIKEDFIFAKDAIEKIPKSSRYGVSLAYEYYLMLLNKIEKTPLSVLIKKRITINRFTKLRLYFKARIKKFFSC